jgi:hypothetical protein
MKKNSVFQNIPCEKCLAKTVDTNSAYKLKPDDKMLRGSLCPSCLSAMEALLGIISWLNENHNEHRACTFKLRDDGRFAEFKIGGCYIKFDSRTVVGG